ncbi:hypothetical protein BCR44DRAFT_126717 [Catenaria anguillulae PL171]|uniref:Lysine--tRNA ligase n=1 Tax=Catenaria anguillulae PL171 TaxID=765915 RepID=A0A1Y2HP38_9FUNG|nr:hypothetical protein BCR44DRAFT_126717 [Catenaria anguillulae PL171]
MSRNRSLAATATARVHQSPCPTDAATRTFSSADYPNFTHPIRPLPLPDFHSTYAPLITQPKQKLTQSPPIALAGRISARRDSGSKLIFLTLTTLTTSTQLVLSLANFADDPQQFHDAKSSFHVGDLVYAVGTPGRTGTGELSLFAHSASKLAPTLVDIPFKTGITDPEKRKRNRVGDLLVNPALQSRLLTRASIMRHIRSFFDTRGFIELDTPILGTQAGGANARPFVTHSAALDVDMHLRVAPELYLKRLVIAGFERVYELGRQFRNEGVDATHNPEFTTCEAYMAYANLDHLTSMTEDLVWDIVQKTASHEAGVVKVRVGDQDQDVVDVNFKPPYRVIDVVPFLEAKLAEPLPDLEAHDAVDKLKSLFARHSHSHLPSLPQKPHTVPRLLDAMIEHMIEPECVQPTFVRGHPSVMSPLAKSTADNSPIFCPFELFVARKELVNAYEELNDPNEQRLRFVQQQLDKDKGDVEAQPPDEEYCRALEYGLPPTAGWGLGVDRLVMMVTGVRHIREVVPFPTVKPKVNPNQVGKVDEAKEKEVEK